MFSSKRYIHTDNPSKVLFALTKLLLIDKVTRTDCIVQCTRNVKLQSVFRIRIRIRMWIHMFFGLPDPDPLVRGMDPDPDPSIIM
jgi:hypothetical protein